MKQLPIDEWDTVQLPGAVREILTVEDEHCIHGVPLQLGCKWCPHRKPRARGWRRWWP